MVPTMYVCMSIINNSLKTENEFEVNVKVVIFICHKMFIEIGITKIQWNPKE